MIKELFLAIILGALLGFGVTGGYFALNKHKTQPAATSVTPTVSLTSDSSNQPTPTPDASYLSNENLIVNSPLNNSVVNTAKVTINGITTSNSTIIITTPLKSYTLKSGTSGSFTTDIELESGFNQIQVTAIDEQDNQTDTKINVTYSTAKI